jgi:F-type H+-transporting ATPase subunit a
MHEEHELWLTALFNKHLAGPANAFLEMVGMAPHAGDHGATHAAGPWTNWMVMQLLVVALIVVLVAIIKARLSVDKPGTVQQMFEMLWESLYDLAHDVVGHGYKPHVYLFSTVFVFILFSNLLGIIPGFESPTMSYYVPAGVAIIVFLYFNYWGFKENGVGYLKHFAGPVWWLMPFMFVVEIISVFIRPVSLTIRLFANMLAGEQVTIAFLKLVPWGVPVIFMGLHTFVSFVQAFIFTVLTMAYVAGSVEHEH